MTSTSQLSEEEINFTRFFLLNFKVSPDIVRQYFDGVFPPAHLSQTIKNGMKTIIQLNKSKIINSAQLKILRSVLGTVWPSNLPPMPVGTKSTCSKDFDLTMMICLLRNLGGLVSPVNGWDQLPDPIEVMPGANLATLRWYRNQLAHTTGTSMDSNEYKFKWTQVKKALTVLNGGQIPQEINDIVNYDLGGEQAKTLANAELMQLKKEYMDCEKEHKEEINQIKNEYMECEMEKIQIENDFSHYREGNIPKYIADANAALVNTWLKDDESFYETRGTKLVYDKVKECSCIMVTSSSGIGKTANIRHIALKFKVEGFGIVPIESPKDIIKFKTHEKQVFLMDDVLGRYDLNPTLLNKWVRINEKLLSCFKTGSSKILCTMRSQIVLNNRFKNASTILNKEVINLESFALSKKEKMRILMKNLQRNNLEKEIKREEVEIMCETIYAFPLLCKLVSDDKERFKRRIAFFKQPVSLLRKELDMISHENKKLYCILVICMLNNGSFSKKIFDIDSDEYDAKIYKIMQTCGLQRNMHKKELEDSAISAVGSYFNKDSYNFRFIHDTLEETISYHFYTFHPKVMIFECDILFIRDRVKVHSNENDKGNDDENTVIILANELDVDRLTPLYTRVWTELNNGRFSSMLMSHLFENSNFVRIFGIHLENKYNKLKLKNTFFKTVSSERRKHRDRSIFKNILTAMSNKNLQDKKDAISRVIHAIPFRSTLMYWILAFGCYELFKYAWSKMSAIDRSSILGKDCIFIPSVKPFFPLAVLGGSLEIVKELILSGADVNCFSEFWETPLYIAAKAGSCDIVCLLVENRAQLNKRGWFEIQIPSVAISTKHELTSCILAKDLNQTELHEAVRQNDLKYLESKIRSENINSRTKSGWTVLHYAVLLDNLEAVEVLFHKKMPQNDYQGKLLCNKPTPKVNIADNNGLTAVHLAVMKSNIEILSILLRNKGKVKVRDVFDRTPLHYIMDESTTRLLIIHSSRNQQSKTNGNAEDGREYDQSSKSAFKVMCFNIALKTWLRNVGRDFVNMPDIYGNTPLHSLVIRSLSKEKTIECRKTLLQNGANPYIVNESNIDALKLIHNCETVNYINNDEKYRQSIMKSYFYFTIVTMFLFAVTMGLIVHISYEFTTESDNVYNCVGQTIEKSGIITLVQVSRNLKVVIPTVGMLWISSIIIFNMRCSNLLRGSFLLLYVVILTCGLYILFGELVYIQTIYRFMLVLVYGVMLCIFLTKWMTCIQHFAVVTLHVEYEKISLHMMVIIMSVLGVLSGLCCFCEFMGKQYDNLYTVHNQNTLIITAFNCTEFSYVDISCISLANNITYKNGVDFSVQCRTIPNITSYNGTHGTLTVDSGVIDLREQVLMFLLFLIFLIHNACVLFLLNLIPYHLFANQSTLKLRRMIIVILFFKVTEMIPFLFLCIYVVTFSNLFFSSILEQIND
ncbi:uncharacterized protein LOC134701116 [Mytilus trossulus]|uniref:uncharacterized protein LOC134701116 n=1 Tax=Mytilus trossulus TaxID=6551 RepID=UPI0030053365